MYLCAFQRWFSVPRLFLRALIVVTVGLLAASTAAAATLPELPRIFLDTTPVPPTGTTIAVPDGGDVQSALNAAQPGDVITLQAGATFTGPFVLPLKSGSGWITVRTSAPDSSLPPDGSRITPAWASVLPKLVSQDVSPVLTTAPGAHNYRFLGVEFTVASGVAMNYGLIQLGDGSSAQTALSQVPDHLTFDRVYVHGNSTVELRRGFALNSASTAIINSYIADVHQAGTDSQAIAGWNGPGPFKIVNNYIEASTENILFGGADPSIPNLVPADIEIRGNHFDKQLAWMQGNAAYAGTPWTIKNLFELKNAERVLVDGNVFEHNWPQAQNGYSILFTVRDQDGTAPWSTVADVTFTHNVVRHVASGVNVLGEDDIYPSQEEQRLLIQNNLFDDVNAATWGGDGRLFQLLNAAANLTIDHNTAFQSGEFILASELPEVSFVYTNNLMPNNQYGLGGDSCFGLPLLCISSFLPSSLISNNAIVGGDALLYPLGNFFPASMAAVGFADLAGGNYQLSSASPLKNAGTDGKDVGVDWNALVAATAGAISGGSTGQAPPPSDVTPPTVSIWLPAAGATVSGSVMISANAYDSQSGVAQVALLVDGVQVGMTAGEPYQAAWDTTTAAAGDHTVSAVATDGAGNQGIAPGVVVTVSNGTSSPPSAGVIWTTLVNATASGGSLRKAGGCDGCQDSGAVSSQAIASGDGYVEFTVGDVTTEQAVGLSHGNTDTSIGDIDFALLQWPGGEMDVREGGTYRADTTAAVGDTFRVSVSGGKVIYSRNGTVFYQSAVAPAYPLLVDSALLNASSVISNAVLVAGASSGVPPPPPPPTGSSGTPITWTSLTNVTASGASLQKTGGCDGCQDAGAVAAQTLASGDGYVEFTVGELTSERALGLSHRHDDDTLAGIDFALLLWPGGEVDVRENGTYHADVNATVGDTFRVAVSGGTVVYSRNGSEFYRSSVAPAYPLLASASILTMSGTFTNVVMSGGAAAVTWTSPVNVTASGSTLQKTGGCDGCQDAGAVSVQTLASDGYVAFTLGEVTTERAIGLSHGNTDTTIADIDFGLLIWPGGEVDVRENGTYKADTTGAIGDTFRVAVSGGRVVYSKNGVPFYQSTLAPVYPLLVDTSILGSSGVLANVLISSGP